MAWIVLIIAALLEPVWAGALSASNNFRRPKPTALFFVAVIPSIGLLAYAMSRIPVGTAYAVFVGIGTGLIVITSALRGEERLTWLRGGLLALLIGSVIGLRLVSA